MPGPGAERRVVNGVERLRLYVADRVEAWISTDLDFVVREHVRDEAGEATWEMYGIERGEPDAALFRTLERYRPAQISGGGPE